MVMAPPKQRLKRQENIFLPWLGAYYDGPKFKRQPASGTGLFM